MKNMSKCWKSKSCTCWSNNCGTREMNGGSSSKTQTMPWGSWLPVIPHISLKKRWHICGDRSAVHCSTSRQRPFAAQHNHLLKWNWRGANLLFSHLCQDESQSTFGPCSYAVRCSPASNRQLVFHRDHRSMTAKKYACWQISLSAVTTSLTPG